MVYNKLDAPEGVLVLVCTDDIVPQETYAIETVNFLKHLKSTTMQSSDSPTVTPTIDNSEPGDEKQWIPFGAHRFTPDCEKPLHGRWMEGFLWNCCNTPPSAGIERKSLDIVDWSEPGVFLSLLRMYVYFTAVHLELYTWPNQERRYLGGDRISRTREAETMISPAPKHSRSDFEINKKRSHEILRWNDFGKDMSHDHASWCSSRLDKKR
eukprot:jgi/Psemu1/70600/estExt_Genemark1.C_27480004